MKHTTHPYTLFPNDYMSDVLQVVRMSFRWFVLAEFGGVVILSFTFGIVLGEISNSTLDGLAQLFSVIAALLIPIIGVVAVFTSRYARRTWSGLLTYIAMATLMAAHLSKLFGVFVPPISSIFFDVGSVLLLLILTLNRIDDAMLCVVCRHNTDRRSKERSNT